METKLTHFNMKKNFIMVLYTLIEFYIPLKAQEYTCSLYRYDTIQIEQTMKKFLTDKIDTSYIRICIPNNDIKPCYDLNYDRIDIICDDSTFIRVTLYRGVIYGKISYEMEKKYGKNTIKKINEDFLDSLKNDFVNVTLFNLPTDSSLHYPKTCVYEGIDKNGKCWKLVLLEYISIGYENVPLDKKKFYDFILNEYQFLSPQKVANYHRLPLYK